MEKTVNVGIIQRWVDENSIAELAMLSELSVHFLIKIKSKKNPVVPVRDRSRIKLAAAIGVPEEVLFPTSSDNQAS